MHAAGRQEAGVDGGDHLGGGRSYGIEQNGAAEHDRRSWGTRSAPGSVMSALMGSDASGNSCGYGGATAGSDVLAGSAVKLVRGRNGR